MTRRDVLEQMLAGRFLFRLPWRLALRHDDPDSIPVSQGVAYGLVRDRLIRASTASSRRSRWLLTRKGREWFALPSAGGAKAPKEPKKRRESIGVRAPAPRCSVHRKRGVYCDCGIVVRPCCQDGRRTCDWCDHHDAEYRARRASPRGNKPEDAARILYGGRRL